MLQGNGGTSCWPRHTVEYLERFELITFNQFGFRRGYSTEEQLLFSDLVSKVDQRNIVHMVYFDLSKSFDVVSHRVLIGKVTRLVSSVQIVGCSYRAVF